VGQQTADQTLDLNKTGELVTTEEVAYHLTATDQRGQPVTELWPEQAWRARAFTEYTRGSWSRGTNIPTVMPFEPGGRDPRPIDPAEFGPDGYVIRFQPGEKERFPVLASPVWWVPNKSPAHWLNTNMPWHRASDGAFLGLSTATRMSEYRQTALPPPADGLGRPFELRGAADTQPLVKLWSELPRVREYAGALLDQAIRDGKLPAAAKTGDPARGRTNPKYHEPIARLFCDHFARVGEFTYATTLRKEDVKADPVEDFLLNTRSGNCELFATSLALLLRAVDVPAQYVSGYKGWELDDDGNLVIRRRHAHAWVEVLVSRPPPAGFRFHDSTPPDQRTHVWHWLTLDPTVGSAEAAPAASKSWVEQGFSFITDFIVGYDKEKRKRAIAEAVWVGTRVAPFAALALASLLCGRWVYRRWRRNRLAALRAAFPGPPWYAHYLELLARGGITPHGAETPKEFAERAAAALRPAHPLAADVPPFVASKLYRARYAGVPLTPEEESLLSEAVARLDRAFPSPPRGATR
jgi:hypothetical protein